MEEGCLLPRLRLCPTIVIARECLPAGRQGATEAIAQYHKRTGDCHACVPKHRHFGVQARSLRSLAMTKGVSIQSLVKEKVRNAYVQ